MIVKRHLAYIHTYFSFFVAAILNFILLCQKCFLYYLFYSILYYFVYFYSISPSCKGKVLVTVVFLFLPPSWRQTPFIYISGHFYACHTSPFDLEYSKASMYQISYFIYENYMPFTIFKYFSCLLHYVTAT